jgi:hypothetical protein
MIMMNFQLFKLLNHCTATGSGNSVSELQVEPPEVNVQFGSLTASGRLNDSE